MGKPSKRKNPNAPDAQMIKLMRLSGARPISQQGSWQINPHHQKPQGSRGLPQRTPQGKGGQPPTLRYVQPKRRPPGRIFGEGELSSSNIASPGISKHLVGLTVDPERSKRA